jgi:hypothetical protein
MMQVVHLKKELDMKVEKKTNDSICDFSLKFGVDSINISEAN